MRVLTFLRTRWNRFIRVNQYTLFLTHKSTKRFLTLLSRFFGGFVLTNSISFEQFKTFPPNLHLTTAAMAESSNKKTKTMNFIADAVETAAPAVVHIDVLSNHSYYSGQVSSHGSGFIVSEDGMLLTNAHVVRNSSKVQVKLASGETYDGYVVDFDEETDLAAVKLDCKSNMKFPFVKLGSSANVRPGEFVAALGSPLQLSNTVTSGIVSTLHRGSGEIGLRNKNMGYIQTDAAINIGNSGGPLINLDGEVIGINCITVQQASGISFAIPSDVATEFLEGAIRKQKHFSKDGVFLPRVKRNDKFYIGITMLTLTPAIIQELQLRNSHLFGNVKGGVLVAKVSRGSPSERCGLVTGDVIISINNKEIRTTRDVYSEVRKGDTMVIKVQRANNTVTLNVEPEISSRL